MPKKKPTKIKPVNSWVCKTCNTKEMSHAEMLTHLKDKHGLDTKGLKATQRMTSHTDGREFFESIYDVFIGEPDNQIVLQNYTLNERDENDMMRYV